MCEEQARCVYCNSTRELEADPHLEAIWVCRECRERREAHQSAIDFGYDDEDPSFE